MGRGVIGNLQALRGIAAVSVVFYHTGFQIGAIHTDFAGVAIFFVISGFIICFIAEDAPGRFLQRRIMRIVPIYWIATVAMAVAVHRWAFFRPWNWHADFALDMLRSLLFIPSTDHPFLGVGWTLNLEMYFYALFAASLWISRRQAPLIAAAALTIGIASPSLGCWIEVCTIYSHHYVEFFVYGILLYYAWRGLRSEPQGGTRYATWGWVLILLCYVAQAHSGSDILAVAVVGAALVMTANKVDTHWRGVLLLGDASYAIYLTHTITMMFLPRDPASLPISLLVTIVCTAVGIAVHTFIEKPLLSAIRRRSYPMTSARSNC